MKKLILIAVVCLLSPLATQAMIKEKEVEEVEKIENNSTNEDIDLDLSLASMEERSRDEISRKQKKLEQLAAQLDDPHIESGVKVSITWQVCILMDELIQNSLGRDGNTLDSRGSDYWQRLDNLRDSPIMKKLVEHIPELLTSLGFDTTQDWFPKIEAPQNGEQPEEPEDAPREILQAEIMKRLQERLEKLEAQLDDPNLDDAERQRIHRQIEGLPKAKTEKA